MRKEIFRPAWQVGYGHYIEYKADGFKNLDPAIKDQTAGIYDSARGMAPGKRQLWIPARLMPVWAKRPDFAKRVAIEKALAELQKTADENRRRLGR